MAELGRDNVSVVLVVKGTVLAMKNAERKRPALLANLGDLNRPLRVRPVNVMGRDWWAVDVDDTWPGMVMDLRRLGFESMAWGEEVLVAEGSPPYEQQMDGPAIPGGLKPFPIIQPTIQIQKDPRSVDLSYFDELNDPENLDEDEFESDEDLQYE